MSEWKPNHKPVLLWAGDMGAQWDTDRTECLRCRAGCSPSTPCRCCLAAEVEALRETVARVREFANREGCGVYALVDDVLAALDGER